MINEKDIQTRVAELLMENGFNVVASEKEEGFQKPAVFVNVYPATVTLEGAAMEHVTDTVEIKLDGERFTGINTIKLETLSDIDKSIIKTETAKYSLAGEKISGMSIREK